jgi:hypothetical protein
VPDELVVAPAGGNEADNADVGPPPLLPPWEERLLCCCWENDAARGRFLDDGRRSCASSRSSGTSVWPVRTL